MFIVIIFVVMMIVLTLQFLSFDYDQCCFITITVITIMMTLLILHIVGATIILTNIAAGLMLLV